MSLGLANPGDFRAICECFNYKQKENFTKVAEPGSLRLEAKVKGGPAGLTSGAHPQSSSEFTEPGSSSRTSSDWTVKATEEAHAEHSVKGNGGGDPYWKSSQCHRNSGDTSRWVKTGGCTLPEALDADSWKPSAT